jgi:anthranilate synthase/aminodeoxychorismate synthase-like glutamine amidotransferase
VILLVDNYDSFTYNVFQLIETLGFDCKVVRNDAISPDEVEAMKPEVIVISPGPGNPDEAGVSLALIERFAATTPILGVCLGHQAIGQAFGGEVVRAKAQRHGKTSRVRHCGDGIYAGVPNPFVAARYHSLVIRRESLPDCLEVTAETDDGVIMGVRHKSLRVEGVQFHPESVATPEGQALIKNFLEKHATKKAGGQNPKRLRGAA